MPRRRPSGRVEPAITLDGIAVAAFRGMRNCHDVLDTARLYRDYAAAVTRWAGRLGRSGSDAEDIVQEVFLVVERRRSTLPPLRNPAAWLYRITANIVRRKWRDRSRHALAQRSLDQWLDTCADESPSPFDDLAHRRRMESLDRAIDSLGPRDRRLLWLCDVRRLPTSRISALTGIKPQTLRVRRFRARMQIARQMRDCEDSNNPDLGCSVAEKPRLGRRGSIVSVPAS